MDKFYFICDSLYFIKTEEILQTLEESILREQE